MLDFLGREFLTHVSRHLISQSRHQEVNWWLPLSRCVAPVRHHVGPQVGQSMPVLERNTAFRISFPTRRWGGLMVSLQFPNILPQRQYVRRTFPLPEWAVHFEQFSPSPIIARSALALFCTKMLIGHEKIQGKIRLNKLWGSKTDLIAPTTVYRVSLLPRISFCRSRLPVSD